MDSMHGSVQLLILSTLTLGVLGCTSDSEPGGSDQPGTSLAADDSTRAAATTPIERGEHLLGEWTIDESGGFVVFDQVDDRLAASIGQGACFTDGGFVAVAGDTVTMSPVGESTPSECDAGAPLPVVTEFVTCLEQGCVITSDGDELVAGSRPIRLTPTTLDL